ncbi:hypothetical protein [Pseudophaeobacter sp. A-200-2]|uniref:hypothetical protein n=1 Tax=Pseudophaeobacter sp. A-200-2 TaxID=3098145 RepID=UPI0034D5A9E2
MAFMARKTKRRQLLQNNRYCIYCGGVEKSTTWDHMPNKGMFPKDRPGGLEFPSCEACNQGSKWFEDIVSFIGSIRFDDSSDSATEHFDKKLAHLTKTQPEVIEELRPTRRQLRQAESALHDGGALNLQGEIASSALSLYGAKLAIALHWRKTQQILPKNAQIAVYCISNERLFDNSVPPHLFELLPDGEELRQGKNRSKYPFFFASGKAEDTSATVHWATFGQAIAYNLFVGGNLDLTSVPARQLFFPGCLQTVKPKPRLQSIPWPNRLTF